jgi:agmatinase
MLNKWVAKETEKVLNEGKFPIILGGDHASPFGAIQVLAQKYKNFGILHIDAHADLRKAYEGFEYSHASIFNNVVHKIPGVQKLVQVGIRDFSEEEYLLTQTNAKIKTHFDFEIQAKLENGESWKKLCKEIADALPENVYVSFDIDGLNPALCPNTGTPVPGGLSFSQAQGLLVELVAQGKKIVGADLCEVAPKLNAEKEQSSQNSEISVDAQWDANVGARVLYSLCAVLLASQLRG